jgi:hypothetical protein
MEATSVAVSVDASNRKSVKLISIFVRFFCPFKHNIKLLDVHSVKGETPEIFSDAIRSWIQKYKIEEKVVGPCGCSSNIKFGGVLGRGKISVITKLKDRMRRDKVAVIHFLQNLKQWW